MSIKELGEFGLIARIKGQFPVPEGVTGIGDDCAVLPQHDGLRTLVSTDMLVEGTHFLLGDISPYRLGWKSAAVNISDIAAMGGKPVATFLSLALPPAGNVDSEWMDEFIRGYRDVSDRYGVALLGGDTTSSQVGLCINVTVLGEAAPDRIKTRDSARVGDLVCVTGTLGDSGAGLRIILDRAASGNAADAHTSSDRVLETLVARHYEPVPCVRQGLLLGACQGVHAMMDISDGIASDLRHIMKASGVGAEIDVNALPLSSELKAYCECNRLDTSDFALASGEDYQLLFTLDPAVHADASLRPDTAYTVIGRITAGDSIVWKNASRDFSGFRHF